MTIGDQFSLFQEFEEKLKDLRKSTYQPFFKFIHTTLVETKNKNLKNFNQFNPELKYTTFVVQCFHYGTYESKAVIVSKINK